MNTAKKIDSLGSYGFQHRERNAQAMTTAIQQVETKHASRMRRMLMVLGGATAFLVINGLLILAIH